VAEVLRSRCVVVCTVCRFVSDWHGHVRGWEGSMARRSSGLCGGCLDFVQRWVSLLCGRNVHSTVRMALVGKCYWLVWGGSLFCLWVHIRVCCGGCVLHTPIVGHCFLCNVCVYNLYSWRWAYRCPKHVEIFMIINHNCCIKLVHLVIFIYDARSHIHHISNVEWF